MRRLCLCAVLLCGCGGTTEHATDETVVPMDQVPEAAMKAARAELPGVQFDTAWQLENGAYEIRGKTAEGKIRDLQVTASGEVLEID